MKILANFLVYLNSNHLRITPTRPCAPTRAKPRLTHLNNVAFFIRIIFIYSSYILINIVRKGRGYEKIYSSRNAERIK